MRAPRISLAVATLVAACSSGKKAPAPDAGMQVAPVPDAGPALVGVHTSSIALSADGSKLFVVNADSDSVSIVDPVGRTLVSEILLAPTAPTLDSDGGYTPSVMPRTLALSPDGTTLYVTGERSGELHLVDVTTGAVMPSGHLCSEPVGVVAAPDGSAVYVSCAADALVLKVDTHTLQITGSLQTSTKPWALALLPDETLLATNFLIPAQVTAIDSVAMTLKGTWPLPDSAARISASSAPLSDPRLAHGQVRGLYDIAPRPGTDELWIPHLMLGTDTPQPALDFETTVFPTVTVMHSDGQMEDRMSVDAQDVAGINGAFADVVSGPHAIAFTADGAFALVVDTNSEDVLVVDANARLEASLLRPLPGHMPEGIAVSPDGQHAYVDERNTGDIAVLDIERADGGVSLAVDGDPIPRLMSDPMPSDLRLGQHLFYSANSDEYPITTNHWVSCATCHLEGASDAVIWRFLQGPRDTPSNAGGVLHTGFMLRTADMRDVQDYWRIINNELGGQFSGTNPAQAPLLDALAGFVNHGIPLPIPPATDPTLVARGQAIFNGQVYPDIQCFMCHGDHTTNNMTADGGALGWFTDSALGNPDLQLDAGACETWNAGDPPCVLLHNVGTCDVPVDGGDYPDFAHDDIWGDLRDGCAYDTPTLRGIVDTPPYFHDGRAQTLMDVLTVGAYVSLPDGGVSGMANTGELDGGDMTALVEYLRSL